MGLNSIYTEPSKKKQKAAPQNPNNGTLGTAKQTAKEKIQQAVNARSGGFADIVRGPNKKEKLVDFLWAKLPYHPQYMRRGTRFDAPLQDALQFGTEPVKVSDLAALGSQPSSDSVARVRLLTALDSASAKQGEPVDRGTGGAAIFRRSQAGAARGNAFAGDRDDGEGRAVLPSRRAAALQLSEGGIAGRGR